MNKLPSLPRIQLNDPALTRLLGDITNQVNRLTSSDCRSIDVPDDVIVDDYNAGCVLKSPDGHYWRLTVDNAGVITSTDLGTTKP